LRVIEVDATESQGACWARNLASTLWDGEDYVLQIDSHMRFADEWDVKLLAQLAECPSVKPMLTTYPPGYEPPDHLVTTDPIFLVAKQFEPTGILSVQGYIAAHLDHPKPSAFIAGGFLFGKSDWIHEVPYDPFLYFNGEEITLAARLWTHGWDFFCPSVSLLWHRYGNAGRPVHHADHKAWIKLQQRSFLRMRHLLGMQAPDDTPCDLAPYDLGTERSLEQYQQFSGIHFQERTIADYALTGDFSIS
jgi:glycosyltransferase involved in cell wall biosynthesis